MSKNILFPETQRWNSCHSNYWSHPDLTLSYVSFRNEIQLPSATIRKFIIFKYYFAITAFDTQRNISDFSEEVCADITESTVTEYRVDEIIAGRESGHTNKLIFNNKHCIF